MPDTISGIFANVKADGADLIDATKWTMDRTAEEKAYAAASTNGYRRRNHGNKDATGSLEGYLDPDDTIEAYIKEGDLVELDLYIRATPPLYHNMPAARIINCGDEGDIEEGNLVKWKATWGTDGEYFLYQTS